MFDLDILLFIWMNLTSWFISRTKEHYNSNQLIWFEFILNWLQKPEHFEEFLETIRPVINVKDSMSNASENPIEKFKHFMGLKRKSFPKHPYASRTIFNFRAGWCWTDNKYVIRLQLVGQIDRPSYIHSRAYSGFRPLGFKEHVRKRLRYI